jgi:hypothetical protein
MDKKSKLLIFEISVKNILGMQKSLNRLFSLFGYKVCFSNKSIKSIGNTDNYPSLNVGDVKDAIVDFHRKHSKQFLSLKNDSIISYINKDNGFKINFKIIKRENSPFTKLLVRDVQRQSNEFTIENKNGTI